MKSTALAGALFVLLLLAAFSWAAPKPEEYSINVHVSSSQWMMTPGLIGPEAYQKLNVTIDGKKYALEESTFWRSATTKRSSSRMSTRTRMTLSRCTSFSFPTKKPGSSQSWG
jgi:hypothetical protein